MTTIILRDELNDNHDKPFIRDLEGPASYNWLDSSVPTIVVPGIPNKWAPLIQPKQLEKDSGLHIIAQNPYRFPERPLEPLFRALFIQNPQYNVSSINIVTDRNNLRQLFSFIQGKKIDSFQMIFEWIGDTLLICRHDTKVSEFLGPNDWIGYGHTFEKAYTTNPISNTSSHYRIVTYVLGHLKLMVRYEADGYVASDMLGGLPGSMTLNKKDPVHFSDSRLVVENGGQSVSSDVLLEIKTRSWQRPLQLEEIAPQLWISQTSKLVRSYHRNGLFKNPSVENVKASVKKWEEQNRVSISKLCDLLERLRNIVHKESKNSLLYDVSKDHLVVYESDQPKMLTKGLYDKWSKNE